MAFVSSSNNNTSSTNEAVNTAHGVSTASTQVNAANSTNIDNLSDAVICAFFASQPNSPQLVHEDLQQIHPNDMEEMDLRWQMAMLTMRARRFLKTTGRKLIANGNETNMVFDKFRSGSATTANKSDFAKEIRAPQDIRQQEQGSSNEGVWHVETSTSTYFVSCDGLLNKLIECQIVDNCKKGLGYENYNAVPPPYTGNFMPPTPDLSFTGLDEFVNEPVVENCKAMSSKEEPKVVRKNNDAPIIEEWVSDSEEENVSQTKTEKKTVKPSIAKIEFVKPKQYEKTAKKTVKQVEQHRQNTYSPRGNQRNWNNMMPQRLGSNFEMFNKACYVCGSFDHLQVDCNYHQKQFQNQRMVKPVWNNAQRVNHKNFTKKTHPCAKKNMVPRAVLMKSGLVSINTARQVNTGHSKTTVNAARPMSYLSKIVHSTVKMPIHKNIAFKNSNINQRVNTARDKKINTARPKAVVNAVKGNNFNAVKASACWVWKPKTKVLDHVSKHNNASITLKKFNYVNAQDRSKHMTWNLSYLTDYKEIDGGYVAFGGKEHMYSVDLKNIVPKGGLTCLFAKATSDESELWHRRLGHINFKTMNKLVKVNLVRGLPSKLFKNNQTCVACQKGKQQQALYVQHIVTDDYSRFSWVFFLATKDETSGILKSFITRVENLIDQRVKVIRCDNGTEFKNKEMNQFCERKGIKREFSVARTPQQNGVAERKNRTLIEAARTMLADSKLPTTFWAEAVNTACYVQNRVLVTKPHNKTSYELFLGRKPALGFMRPFRCLVIILSTIDLLSKFDGKVDEGFFVRYSINSKAFRVSIVETWIVEEICYVQKACVKDAEKVEDRSKKDSDKVLIKEKDDVLEGTNMLMLLSTNDEVDMNNRDKTIQDCKEEVYVSQLPGFEDLNFPDRRWKDRHDFCLQKGPKSENSVSSSATVKVKNVNGEVQLQALVDEKKIIVTKASVRCDLQLNDEEGTDCFAIDTILKSVKGWERVKSSDKEGLGDEYASKQGRIADIDADVGINLVSTHFDADTDMFGVHDLVGDEVVVESKVVVKAASTIPVSAPTTTTTVITNDEITLAKALAELKSAKLPTTTAAITITVMSTRPRAKGLVIHE
ncbi:putative ribonuclease H-like domain-containing protein [Tanacetum coccineum]